VRNRCVVTGSWQSPRGELTSTWVVFRSCPVIIVKTGVLVKRQSGCWAAMDVRWQTPGPDNPYDLRDIGAWLRSRLVEDLSGYWRNGRASWNLNQVISEPFLRREMKRRASLIEREGVLSGRFGTRMALTWFRNRRVVTGETDRHRVQRVVRSRSQPRKPVRTPISQRRVSEQPLRLFAASRATN